jgi:transposase-like protein
MAFDKDYLRELLSSKLTFREMTHKVMTQLVNEILQVDMEDFVMANNQTLPDGRDRLVQNGSYPRDVLSMSGKLSLRVPRVLDRGGDSPVLEFRPSMLPRYLKCLDDVTDLIPWMCLNGFSTSQFGDIFSHMFGEGFRGLSPSTISAVVKSWDSGFEEWAGRDLSGQFFPYLWADGVNFNVRGRKSDNQSVLVAVGFNREGRKELVGMAEGFEEDSEIWRGMFLDLRERGLRSPLLTVSDGGRGLLSGLRSVFPDCLAQACFFHKQMNVRAHLPKSLRPEGSRMLREVRMQPTRADAVKAAEAFDRRFRNKYPKAAESVIGSLDRLLRFYDFPARHWIHLRTNNPVENVFSTVRLRTDRMRGMMSSRNIFTMVFRLAQIACGRSRAINGAGLIAELERGCRFGDGEPVVEESGAGD